MLTVITLIIQLCILHPWFKEHILPAKTCEFTLKSYTISTAPVTQVRYLKQFPQLHRVYLHKAWMKVKVKQEKESEGILREVWKLPGADSKVFTQLFDMVWIWILR